MDKPAALQVFKMASCLCPANSSVSTCYTVLDGTRDSIHFATCPDEFVGAVFHPLVESSPSDMLPYCIPVNSLLAGSCHRSVVMLKGVSSAIVSGLLCG